MAALGARGCLDTKMPPKRIAKRTSPSEDAAPRSKKVKDSRNQAVKPTASCSGPSTHSCQVSHRSHHTEAGVVLSLGQGDVGQLGLGDNVMERKKPALVPIPEEVVQAEAGGMHTVCLSKSGQIYSFGCNDEGALGRDTSVEGSEMVPGKVELQEKVVQVSAGDSHTAALTEDGRVFLWGSFRDNNGVIGLLEPMKKSMVPVPVELDVPVVKVASGNDHLVMLTVDGDLYTLGCGEQGQLGRVPELFANRGGRKGLERLLVPKCVMLKSRGSRGYVRFQDAFCGAYFTFAISREGHVYGFGLSNYHQLGTPGTESCFVPQNLTSFKNSTKSWVGFSGGQHHTVCMDSEGKAYSLGRAEYGRLGLGEGAEERSIPTLISRLPCVSSVACGASVGYAVTKDASQGIVPRILGKGRFSSQVLASTAEEAVSRWLPKPEWMRGTAMEICWKLGWQKFLIRGCLRRLPEEVGLALHLEVSVLYRQTAQDGVPGRGTSSNLKGRVFSWGMGTNYQLGTGQDDDAWSPVEMTGKQLENRVVLSVSSGGQHTVLLVKDKEQS